jgi:transposase
VRGIEPTNNAAERALRHAVLWRKSSGGTASGWGSRFVERALSVAATCRRHGRNVMEFLTECFRAQLTGGPLPSLLARRVGIDSL